MRPPSSSHTGQVPRLAENVPARDFETGERADDRQVGALRESAGVCAPEHLLDISRCLALHVPLEHVPDDGGHCIRPDRTCVALAPSGDAVIGRDLDQNPVAPAPSGSRWGRNNHDEIIKSQGRMPPMSGCENAKSANHQSLFGSRGCMGIEHHRLVATGSARCAWISATGTR